MKRVRKMARRGFSLVELLAVVLVLAVLAGVAVPLYLNTRKESAARTCKANIAAIAAAESAYATRFGKYLSGVTWKATYAAGANPGDPPTDGLIGAPEGLTAEPKCPLKGGAYSVTASGGDITISCADAATHATDVYGASSTNTAPWSQTLKAGGTDTTNPL